MAASRPKTPCRLSISKVSGGGGVDGGYINLRLSDEASGIQFVDIEMSFKTFGEIVSGGSHTKVAAELRGLQYVGKQRVREDRSVLCPLKSGYPREPLEEWLTANCQEEGWIIDPYLGSQGSVTTQKDGLLLRYNVHKFI